MSDFLHQYSIQFSGLAIGKHHFDFRIEDKFFEELPHAVIQHGDISIQLDLEKSATMIILNFVYHGNVSVVCDRCTVGWDFPITGNDRLIIQFGDIIQAEQSDDNIIYLPRTEYQINISQHIYEYVATSLPLRIIPCEITGNISLCDQTILQKLNELSASKENQDSGINPLWEKLQILKKNTKQ